MHGLTVLAVVIIVVAPLAWLIAEFRGARWVRVVLGLFALGLSFALATVVGSIHRLNYNARCG